MKRTLLWMLGPALISGCATLGGWEPVVDRRVDAHPETIDRDIEQCRQLAKQASGGVGTEAAKGGAVGAAGGAAIGAMLGAIGGNAGSAAAAGAVIGGAGGSASQGLTADEQYKISFIKCMEGRGHRVIN